MPIMSHYASDVGRSRPGLAVSELRASASSRKAGASSLVNI